MSHVDDGTLHAYLDGELTPAEAQGVDAHLAQCPACRRRVDEERALIARADELLGIAAPPHRDVPPFRPGDVEPPVRLWWRLRLPLAWAATVVVALGAGMYLGRGAPGVQPASQASDFAADASSDSALEPRLDAKAERRAPISPPRPARSPSAAAERKQAQAAPPARARAREKAAPAAAPTLSDLAAPGPALKGSPLTLDSARALLGTDPLVVPDLPINGVYAGRLIGYSPVVVVEQALDSNTAIDVISGRANALVVDRVVVTGAARPDSERAGERALRGRAGGVALGNLEQRADERDRPALIRFIGGLQVQLAGPLAPDSLRKLLQKVQPAKR